MDKAVLGRAKVGGDPSADSWSSASLALVTLKPSCRSASSMPPCRSPTVFILARSTPMVTSVWAISGDRPVMITSAPISRDASTVCTRWFGDLVVEHADDRQDQQPLGDLQHRGGQLADGVGLLPDDALPLLDEADRDRVGDPVRGRLVRVEHPVQQPEVVVVLLEQ
jgi:hypothetical protein